MKETPKKLFAAYVGESQARNRYTFFSSIAKKEGYVLVAKIFQETADFKFSIVFPYVVGYISFTKRSSNFSSFLNT
ncbi:MAG TPA: hypothetical protein ENH98_03055 [archaeon]|nr:hypothetical protein [archaeon]